MTQAMNLANFANSLDTSGGVNPSVLNAAVPISKGGTGQTTIAAAAAAFGALLYPVGSIYINAGVSTNPATLLGFGTWVAFGTGQVPVGINGSDSSFNTLGQTGGSKDSVVVSHTHAATSTVADPGHSHSLISVAGRAAAGSGGTTYYGAYTGIADGPGSIAPAVTGVSVSTTNASSGVSGTNGNLQPYIVVCMWKRTA